MTRPLPLSPLARWAAVVAAGLVVGGLLPGCQRDVVKRDPGLGEGPFPTLLASFQAEVVRTEGGGGLALTGDQLARFGNAALGPVTAAMEKLGFQLELDGDRARALDDLAMFRPSNRLATLTGIWTHPEASAYRFDDAAPGSDAAAARALAAADPEHPYFASLTLYVDEARSLPVSRAPLIRVNVRVVDREGRVPLLARTEGAGRPIAISADRSLENLLLGLDEALLKLTQIKPAPL